VRIFQEHTTAKIAEGLRRSWRRSGWRWRRCTTCAGVP